MASTRLSYLNQIYNAYTPFYTGVVRIMDEETRSYGSGALLYDGRAILTAAHVIDSNPSQLKIMLESSDENEFYMYASNYKSFDNYSSEEFSSHDLALIWLDEQAPLFATRYDIFRDDLIGKTFNQASSDFFRKWMPTIGIKPYKFYSICKFINKFVAKIFLFILIVVECIIEFCRGFIKNPKFHLLYLARTSLTS